MISYYSRDETVFTHNGLGVLDLHIIRPVVYEELNGLFTFEFEYPIKAKHGNHLVPEVILRCPVPDLPDQLFRISERNKATGGRVQIIAHHIFYDLAKNLIEDTFVVNKTATGALTQMLGATQFAHRFTATSNNINVNSARMVRMNPVEIVLDADLENGFRARWGGEIVRNNFTFTMNTARGSDNGVQIRDKKNLTGYKSNLDYSTIVTRIMPEGFDGLFLPERYVDSPLIDHYVSPKIKVIKYDSVKVGEDEGEYTQAEAYDVLRALAQQEYSLHQLDKPSATYEVEFAPLEKTEEYKDFSALESINLGDTVSVIHEDDEINISARMLSYQYDPLQRCYIKISLGSMMPKFTDVAKDIKRAEGLAVLANMSASVALASANGKNTNFYGSITPIDPQLGDIWFKENGEKTEIWIYETRESVTQWYALSNDLTQEQLRQELALAAQEVEVAKASAEEAKAAGLAAQNTADQAQSDAQAAVDSANQAFSNAEAALSTADNASTTAATAYNKSVKSTAVDYAVHTNGATAPTSGWQSSIPGTSAGEFLWTRTVLTMQDNSTVISYSIAKHGNTGAAGEQGADAPVITAVREQYLLSASNTAPSSGSPYTDVVPITNQQASVLTAGAYTNATIIAYMDSQTYNPTASVTTNPYSNSDDYLVVYKLNYGGQDTPSVIKWNGRKDTSDNIVLLRVNGLWQQIGTVTATANTVHTWPLTQEQRDGISGGIILIAFFAIKTGSYAGLYNGGTTPFTLSLAVDGSWSDMVPVWISGRYYWTRVAATLSDNTTTYSTPVLAEGLNRSLVSALEAKSLSQNLQTTVTQHATVIETTATDVTLLSGRVTTAETKLTQTADALTVSLSRQETSSKLLNDLIGINILQSDWQAGTLNTASGAEATGSGYVRSGWFDVTGGEKYLLQTREGTDTQTLYGTAYIFYYRADKTFISYVTVAATNTPFTANASAAYMRIRLTTSTVPADINCYLIRTDETGGRVAFADVANTNVLKLQATSDTLLVTATKTSERLGSPFVVEAWQQGTLNTADGQESVSVSNIRSGMIPVTPGEQYIAQTLDGGSVSAYFHYYKPPYVYKDYIPTSSQVRQETEAVPTGTYTNETIAAYLLTKNIEAMTITSAPTTNPYSASADCLIYYRIPLDGREVPHVIEWRGRKDTSNGIVFLYTDGEFQQIGTVTASVTTVHRWGLTEDQREGIAADNVHLVFFSLKTGAYSGIFNETTAPFTFNPFYPLTDSIQLSYSNTANAITVPVGAVMMRVRIATSIAPSSYTGNVFQSNTRRDYSIASDSITAALLVQNNLINLRVSKGEIINQINLSTEGILIAGNRIQITGTTTISDAVIKTAHIADAAITNAKIANLDAAKISTGTLSADRIAAGSITSAKLNVANGFITNAMIADATIASAKIAALDAGKITTGTLSSDRIAANSITSAKVATNFLETLTGSNSIRITGTTISYYSGSALDSQINANGFEFTRGGTKIGRIGTNNIANQTTWRGLVFDLEYAGNYMSWAWQESSVATEYIMKLTYYRSKLENGKEKGFHFNDTVFFKNNLAVASGSNVVTTQVQYYTFDTNNTFALTTSTSKAGIAMGGSNLILGDDGQWVDFGIIREICKKLSGKTIVFPSAINSSGVVTSWYTAVTMNTMTWWNT